MAGQKLQKNWRKTAKNCEKQTKQSPRRREVWRPEAEGAAPLPGVHNSAWVQSPTHTVLRAYAAGEAAARARLEAYVTAVVTRFGRDERVTR